LQEKKDFNNFNDVVFQEFALKNKIKNLNLNHENYTTKYEEESDPQSLQKKENK